MLPNFQQWACFFQGGWSASLVLPPSPFPQGFCLFFLVFFMDLEGEFSVEQQQPPTTPTPSAWECSSDSSAGAQLSSFLKRPLSSSMPIASSWFLKVIFCRLSSTGLRTLLSQAHSTLLSFYPVVLFLLSLLRTPSVFTVGILQIFWGGLERWGGRHNPRFYNQGYSAIRIRPSDHHCTANLAFLMVFLVYLVELVVQAECSSGKYAVS